MIKENITVFDPLIEDFLINHRDKVIRGFVYDREENVMPPFQTSPVPQEQFNGFSGQNTAGVQNFGISQPKNDKYSPAYST